MPPTDADSLRTVLPDWAWRRHANPWSGWTRFATGPVLVYALYTRNWRLLALSMVWTVLNPVAFPPPRDAEAWMTRAVLAEREWLEAGNGTLGTDWPNLLNLLAFPTTVYLLWTTIRKRPRGATVAMGLVTGLKVLWIREIQRETGFDDPNVATDLLGEPNSETAR